MGDFGGQFRVGTVCAGTILGRNCFHWGWSSSVDPVKWPKAGFFLVATRGNIVATFPCSVPLNEGRFTCDTSPFSPELLRDNPLLKSVTRQPCDTAKPVETVCDRVTLHLSVRQIFCSDGSLRLLNLQF